MNSVTTKEIVRLKLVPRTPNEEIREMAAMLAEQGRRLRELEAKLLKEKQEKANLEMDFQHLLDQIQAKDLSYIPQEDSVVVCG